MTARIAEALLAIAAGDRETAVTIAAEEATASPGARLPAALARHLTGGSNGVYDDPRAFERFIASAGNVALYAAAEHALTAAHGAAAPRRLLDIGCGDGRLTACALQPALERVELVEPSAGLLAAAVSRLDGRGVEVVAHARTAQSFVAEPALLSGWDVAQSTFALHAIEPTARAEVLRAVAGRAERLLVIEFDVPAFADRSRAHAEYAADRYEAGLAEHDGDDLVERGFLLPVLVGQFDPAQQRHTWEQPIEAWVADLCAAGFGTVSAEPLASYWWATAHLVTASPA